MTSSASASSVRRASPDSGADVEALAFLRFTWRTTEGGESGELDVFTRDFGAWWRDHERTHTAFVAYAEDGSPVGMAWLGLMVRIPGPEHFTRLSGFLQSAYVLPEHRGRGFGGALVDAVLARARELGLAYLAVHPTERSYPLYRRAGFSDTSGVLELGFTEPRRP